MRSLEPCCPNYWFQIQADCSTFFYEYDIPEAVANLFIKAEGLPEGKLKLIMYQSYLTISLTLLLVKLKLELEPHLDGDEVFSSQKYGHHHY